MRAVARGQAEEGRQQRAALHSVTVIYRLPFSGAWLFLKALKALFVWTLQKYFYSMSSSGLQKSKQT